MTLNGLLVPLGLCLIASGLDAQVTVYTNRAAWQTAAAALQVTTIGFEGIAPASFYKSYNTSAGLTLNGVNFVGQSSAGYGLAVVDSQYYNPMLYDRGTGASLQSSDSCCTLAINQFNITLPAGVYAAGADLWSVQLDGLPGNGTDTAKMSVNGSAAGSTVTLPYPGLAFLGFVSSTPVSTINFFQSTSGELPELDNFSFGVSAHPAFFTGETSVGSNLYFLQFPGTGLFGYYGYLSRSILYHVDMGYEVFIPASGNSIYFYDFASGHWLYSSASLFPYLYDFSLNAWIYYFPDTKNSGHYTTNPRSFVNLTTQNIFTM